MPELIAAVQSNPNLSVVTIERWKWGAGKQWNHYDAAFPGRCTRSRSGAVVLADRTNHGLNNANTSTSPAADKTGRVLY